AGGVRQVVRLSVEVTAPAEAAPRLTSATPPDMVWGRSVNVFLRGSGLSGTTSVVARPASGTGEAQPTGIFSATDSEVEVSLFMSYGETHPSDFVLELTTAAGTATLPFEVSTPYVDPVNGSDEAGRGTRLRPVASILAARNLCGGCVRPLCNSCPVRLSPGTHHVSGSLTVNPPSVLVGQGELYGANATVIQGQKGDRFTLMGTRMENVKVTGFDKGVEAEHVLIDNSALLVPELTDVHLTGNGEGLTTRGHVTVSTKNQPTTIEDNRLRGITLAGLNGVVTLQGSEEHPIRIRNNGDGSQDAGGVVGFGNSVAGTAGYIDSAEFTQFVDNRGAGVKVGGLKARDCDFSRNQGPGAWMTSTGTTPVDLGSAIAHGRNTLQGNAINLRVDRAGWPFVSAVGNCWDVPEGNDFPEATRDGTCGRLGRRFERDGVTLINDEGKTSAPFTWTGTPRFNYWLGAGGSGSSEGIQF
ncbi:hypothetical protein, partial [Pyxidicoccus fallax]